MKAGGNQLIICNTYNTIHFWSDKKKVWQLLHTVLIEVYRRESNLAISSSPVTKIMYRFYWRTAVKKRNF
jgi:hypothetical protein